MSYKKILGHYGTCRRPPGVKPLPFDRRTSTDPWREVVHIEIAKPGKRGAQPWELTLECGHTVWRSRGDTRDKVAAVSRLWRTGRLRGAPRKCRCLHCGLALRAEVPSP